MHSLQFLATIEPSDMTNQEKKNFQTDEARRQRAATRKEIQKANKAKGKARAEKITSLARAEYCETFA